VTMSAENEDRKPPPRETSPMLALSGTEQPLPQGNHAAFAARAAVNPDERLVGRGRRIRPCRSATFPCTESCTTGPR
jgi:hypothetical protein